MVGDHRLIAFYLSFFGELYEVNEMSFNTDSTNAQWQFMQLTAGAQEIQTFPLFPAKLRLIRNIIFPIFPGNSFHAHTSRLFDWNEIHDQLWISRVTSHVEFAVRAAAEARIALAYEPTNTTGNFYEVILGSSSGSDIIVEHTDEQGRREEMDRAMTSQVVHESY